MKIDDPDLGVKILKDGYGRTYYCYIDLRTGIRFYELPQMLRKLSDIPPMRWEFVDDHGRAGDYARTDGRP